MGNDSDTICFHFDTIESQLNMIAFNQMVNSINIVTNNVSQAFWGEKAKCQINILPIENGSFKSKIKITVAKVATTIGLGVAPILADGIIESLTGHDVKYYGKKTGTFVKDITVGIFSKPKDELNKIIPSSGILDKSIEAKSKFYVSIANDNNIKSLGFSEEDKTLIKKSDRGLYISDDIIRDVDNIEEYAKLTIIKPVTVKSTQSWTLKDETKRRNDDYKILDEEFKSLVWNGYNPLKENKKPDEILAKIEYVKEMKNGVTSTIATNIAEVYQFNNKELKKLPDDFQLNKTKNKKKEDENQLNLFPEN